MKRSKSGSSTRRRNVATLLVLAVLLALAAVGYAVLPTLFSEEGEEAATSLLGVAQDQIEAIAWEGASGSGSIQRVASESEDDTEDSWEAVDEKDVELDGELCDELASALADATVTRTVASEDVTEDMGLDDPDVTVTVTLEDESSLSLALSDPTGEGSACYARVTGDEASGDAYLVSGQLVETFALGMSGLYATEASPSAYDIVDFTVESSAGTLSLTYHEGGDETLSYTSQYEWFASWNGGASVAVDEGAASSLTGVVNYVSWESCVDPSYDGTVDYGFASPTLTSTLNYTKSTTENVGDTDDDGADNYETVTTPGTFVLVVGSQTEDGSYYAQPEGSTKVYTISADDVDALLGASVEDLLPDDVCLMDWDTVESVEVTVDGETTSIELVRDEEDDEGSADNEGESDGDDGDARADSYRVNGEEADTDAVETLLDAIDALASEGEAQDGAEAGESAEVTLVFHRSTESFDTVTLSFTHYDTSFYLAALDGDARLLVNKNDIANLKDLVGEL